MCAGTFEAKDNVAPKKGTHALIDEPAGFDYMRLAHPPVTFRHEKLKIEERIPAAQRYIAEHKLNEVMAGAAMRHADVGLVVQGGIYNAVIRCLQTLGLADAFGDSALPLYVLNVTYPLVPQECSAFCAGKRAVLVLEEGSPEYIEKDLVQALRKADVQTAVFGKRPAAPPPVNTRWKPWRQGCWLLWSATCRRWIPAPHALGWPALRSAALTWRRPWGPLPARPPGFCIGCPERPVFSALKLAQQNVGPVHIAADIGCHALATFEPFSSGHSILGYGMSLASRAGVSPMMQRRAMAIMGDGGFFGTTACSRACSRRCSMVTTRCSSS